MSSVLESPLLPGTKGLPARGEHVALARIGELGWNALDGTLPSPICVLRASALRANLTRFQSYISQSGALFAPHGKTTLCPQLFERQLEAGAWGITVATYAQARLAMSVGVERIFLANQLVSPAEIHALATMLDEDPSIELFSLVDSVEGVERLNSELRAAGARRPFTVLVELGIPGGRTGARNTDAAVKVARAVAHMPALRLVGIEGYEGLLLSKDSRADAEHVAQFLQGLVNLFQACTQEKLFESDRPLISAGGSAYFDLVVRDLSLAGGVLVVRSGCYLTHDHGFYARLSERVRQRAAGPPPILEPAMEVWTHVLSRPEPDLLIIAAGKRDLGIDAGLPQAVRWKPAANGGAPSVIDGWEVLRLNDQHGYVKCPEFGAVKVGDMIGLGISHPCTTFDKWPLIYEVDDDYRVIAGLHTYF